ncbi:NAD-dependent epimerase/dehydratase family protein [Aureimonas leprariae]|uniref:NAD-dependent epimerase/dehydratase family protein n=1 Tax=Plantimonas leprariae TaxID=2615207 RepID=A0A7V7PK72_9HYPH|nr:NAD-dependent epimerase/dehydratase family protein [Aureimonas leprariae]KAB0675906.1 NAD-dependent epimerase/dehydratase family protein [Aureimonas leprariae]
MRRILLTGGAGCLGSNLAERFIDAGDAVYVLDNFATGQRASLPDEHDRLTVREGSVSDRWTVDDVFTEFEPTHVVHSAAAYKNPDDWATDDAVNVGGTINVVRAAEAAGVRRLLNFHTALGYGRPEQVPIAVSAPARPFTSYGISKQAGENYLAMSKLPWVSLRLANVTGPRLAIGPIPTFYTRLKAGKSCFCSRTVRDFVDMEDFFAVVDLALADEAPTGRFNVSTGTGHSIREIFDIVVQHLGLPKQDVPEVDAGPDDVEKVVLDPSETIAAFGWRPRYSFADTIRRMLAWYDTHGVTTIYSHVRRPEGHGEATR